jgi:hypothetical protein
VCVCAALSSGRQGIYLWTLDAALLLAGQEGDAHWETFNLLEHHNQAAAAAGRSKDWLYPPGCADGTGVCNGVTTCYTSMTVVPAESHSLRESGRAVPGSAAVSLESSAVFRLRFVIWSVG